MDDLPQIVRSVLANVEHRTILLKGNLGAGKTTIIKEFCRQLGVEDQATSPTFSIVNEYSTTVKEPVYHFDFYRLESLEEAYDIGAEEYFFSNHWCFVEWPEKVIDLIPMKHHTITIRTDGNTRVFQVD